MPIAALLRPAVPTLAHVTTADELEGLGATWGEPRGAASDPAFIQYTSGSTGSPKGVLLTHANLLANMRAIGRGVEARPTDVGVSWLPLYHDMGLIGSWLFCLHQGLPIAIFSPLAFLARPERWLWTIHERRATLSPAPNFAYELCVRKIPDAALEGLDLSSWRCALNGAEPVSPATLDRFCRRFARYGFRREALMPVYGLAESSVALCVPPVGRGPKLDAVRREAFERDGRAAPAGAADGPALTFVSVGKALPEHEVRVVDDAGADLPERTVGRLVFRGPSTTAGYFRKPEATAAITLPGGWLDSGDLAYQAEGELYVTGRRKDLIIKAGRNLVPQEIEEVASSVPGIRKGCVVAFGVSQEATGTESLIVVAETRETRPVEKERLVSAVVEKVAAAVDLPPDVVHLVAPGSVPKTSSGKIRRAATREAYLEGELGRPRRTPLRRRAALVVAAAAASARPAFARAARWLYAIYLGTVIPPVVLPCWLLALLVPSRRLGFALGRFTVKVGLRLAGCRLSVSGLEHLGSPPGPVILTSNHASYADVPALMALVPLDFVFLAKREALSYFVVGTYLRRAGHLTVDRFDVQQSLADAASITRALGAGDPVLIFPEATFTAAAGLRPFRLGAFKTAVETGAPVVPMALRGTRRVMRGDWGIPRPGPIHLWIGRPVFPEGDDWSAVIALRDRVYETILTHCGEPRLDIVVGGPERP
jgi:1-acyl-sn-glycerol-3-phosphate acyltransferase